MNIDILIPLLAATVQSGTPILYATLGEIFTERSGILNLGVEGIMITGALVGFLVAKATGNPWIAFCAAGLAGSCAASLHGFVCLVFQGNQVVSGLALTILGVGFANYIGTSHVGQMAPGFSQQPIPFLSAIPVLGPIFFSQERVGVNGRIFKCWKYRSMTTDAEDRKKDLLDQNEMNGAIFKIENDPRVTRVGHFLRKTSLDEFPQFWNVLKGEMSLVGTRPPTPAEVEKYEDWHRKRSVIKPGITGMWQVNGRSQITDFDDIVRLDLKYIDHWSFWLDIKILLKTVKVVLFRDGSS
jgi:lipopolysaccharide/colanic/teichoic acid biosynthesis glycosyltransferase